MTFPFDIGEGEQLALVGPNASGKTRLAEAFLSAASVRTVMICFRDSYADQAGTYYLQKRWNSIEIEEDTPTVRQMLDRSLSLAASRERWRLPPDRAEQLQRERRALLSRLTSRFRLDGLLDEYVISLSSAETP